MYEVFDNFCKVPTWDTAHPLDDKRFKAALNEVVGRAGFSPREMGRYIQSNHADPIWPKTDAQLRAAIEMLVEQAAKEQARIDRAA